MSRNKAAPARLDWVARLVVATLRRRLPRDTAADILGDLVEDYRRRTRGRRRWLIAQACNLAWGFRRHPERHDAPRSRATLLDVWLRDTKYAARSLIRSRGFAGVALLSLALGVGLATAVFSVVDGILLRPLPYGEADRIVRLRELVPGRAASFDALPRPLLNYLEKGSRTLTAVGPYSILDARITAGADPVVGVRVDVGARFFDVLQTAPLHGRLLRPSDDDPSAPWTTVLSHAFWQRAFSGDRNAVGRQLRIDDRVAEIVGVLPASFAFPTQDVAVYLPGRWRWPDTPGARAIMGAALDVVARLRPEVTPADAAQEMSERASRTRAASASTATPPVTSFVATRLRDDLVQGVRPALVMLMAAVACVLAIVCVNLTNLFLARGTVRQREMAVRAALGASRWGMARPLALEGLLLSVAGGVAGFALATILVNSLPLAASVDPMLAAHVRIDARVLAFTLAVSALIGVVVGVLPAWQAPSADMRSTAAGHRVLVLPGAAVSAEQMRSALVVVQIALALILAVGAALLSRSLVTLLTVDLGFEPAQALSVQVKLPQIGGAYDWRARFYEQFVDRLATHGGITAAGFSSSLPMRETFSQAAIRIDGVDPPDATSPFRAHREVVTPGYFAAIGVTIVSGRGFVAADAAASERVAIVNDAFAQTFLPGGEAVDRRVMVFGDWCRIVGIARSKRHAGLRSSVRPELYVPLAQSPPDVVTQSGAGLVMRTSGDPLDMVPFARQTLRAIQPQAALEQAAALEDEIWASTAQPRFYATVMGAFALLAVVTALVGLFGVLSYVVERRRVEIGVRRALGATTRDISRLVVGRGMRLVALAVPLGLAGAFIGARLLRSLLFGVQPADTVTFAGVVAVVSMSAVAACAWPARRATSIEPLEALRDN